MNVIKYIGMDVHVATSSLAVLDGNGKRVAQRYAQFAFLCGSSFDIHRHSSQVKSACSAQRAARRGPPIIRLASLPPVARCLCNHACLTRAIPLAESPALL